MKVKVVIPTPYLEVSMQCSNRIFYEVKHTLWVLGEEIDEDQEIRVGFVSEKCDYEGDLESIKIYNCKETKEYLNIIMKHYDISEKLGNLDLVFTI